MTEHETHHERPVDEALADNHRDPASSVPDSEQRLTGEEIASLLEANGSYESAALVRDKLDESRADERELAAAGTA